MVGVQLGEIAASFAGLGVLAALFAAVSIAVLLPRIREQSALLDALGIGSAVGRPLEHNGRRLIARLSEQTARGSRQLNLSTPIAALPRLSIKRLRWIDRFARRCRVAAVAGSGSDEFDRRYLVDCGYRELASVLLGDAAVRDAVQTLFDAGARELRLERGQLTARFDISRLLADAAAEAQLQHWSAALARLGNALPGLTGALTPIAFLWAGRRIALLTAGLALPLLSAILCAIFHDAYMPLDLQALARDALMPLPAVALAGMLLGLLLLRGHPTSGRLLPVLTVAVALSSPPALIGIALVRNGSGDAGPIRIQVVEVTGRERRSDAVPPAYRWSSTQLQRRGLFGAMHPIAAQVPDALWRERALGSARIQVLIAGGRLGHPWVVATAPMADAAPVAAAPSAAAAGPAVAPIAAFAPPSGPRTELRTESRRRLPLASAMVPETESGTALLARAKALYGNHELQPARALLDRSIAALQVQAAPPQTRAEAYWYRARLYESLGASFEAQREADARAALALAPAHSEAALLLDDVLFRSARFEEALQLWTVMLQRKPAYVRGRFQLARALATLGRTAEAKSEARKACGAGDASACELLGSL